MSEVLFYHLERQTLEDVLPTLLEKTLARDWRAVVQLTDEERLDALDRHLWTYRDDSFLPHGSIRDGNAAHQPVWLTTGEDNPNGAEVRFLGDRAEPTRVEDYARVVLLFSADDEVAVASARRLWKPLKAAGHACTYWQQSAAGRWEQKG
ncbi:DNA polymerase III subunit chi [Acuticoccus mangrovi]|uniref:DNA polymerase III subunit chi n=1 Tax=Acuticoccus mangrovi TaxID=2796142 RepID=A0A934IQ71_9HYPH|nr:DNA polymerase III subunit chi [Acuticoccus mangrovi]MBJ3776676.1 DNA polymerase III subunit chi [Acuticoccus mangrovi]